VADADPHERTPLHRRRGRAGRWQGPLPMSAKRMGPRSLLAAFTLTIFLSAVLLFSVQLLVARMVLPVLGGAPGTWAVSLCFFQAMLLLGYAYAHALVAFARAPAALGLHALVLITALVALPITLPALSAPPQANAYLWLLGVLARMVALPFFALSASAPLLQAWFRASGHARSADPYFLYAASNAGSLAALLAYPFLIEPLLPLTRQRAIWAVGFCIVASLLFLCGLIVLARSPAPTAGPRPASPDAWPNSQPDLEPISWRARAQWAILAFVPSGLLVAFTTYLTTDLASAPLLWVIPLAGYLATFVFVFRDRAASSEKVLLALQPAAVAGVLVASEARDAFSWALAAALGFIAFLITALLCHAQLYKSRPDAARLTGFYLWLSLGGVCGGVFAALIAPLLFSDVLEFPLLLLLGMACRPALRRAGRSRLALLALLVTGCAGILLVGRLIANDVIANTPSTRLYVLAALGLAVLAAQPLPRLQLAAMAALVLGVASLPYASAPVFTTRSFFGTHRVVDTVGGTYRLLLHGTTLHGIQRNGKTGERPTPIGYYYAGSPMARSIELARAAAGGERPLQIGIVGLGSGALACYALPGEQWRFFEIDAAVARIATNPAFFHSLSRCTPDAKIVLGDARLTLARQPAGSFDLLILDAFSSDAIPVHLLTVEALSLYERLLAAHGILALHISNQNLDLPPVVAANLALLPDLHAIYAEGERGATALASQVILVSRQAEAIAPALQLPHARWLDVGTVRPWTDDYCDILSAMVRRLAHKLAAARG
jgi:hypothetical protein